VGAGLVAVIEERRKSNRLCILYKIKNGLIDIDSHQYIQANDSRTRGTDRLYQERTSSEAFGNAFFPKTIKVPRKLCAVSGNTAVFYRLFTGKTIYRWELV
jgi:hypothetical protein